MAGLVPAIHVFVATKKDVDARAKRGHDAGASLVKTARYSGLMPWASTNLLQFAISLSSFALSTLPGA